MNFDLTFTDPPPVVQQARLAMARLERHLSPRSARWTPLRSVQPGVRVPRPRGRLPALHAAAPARRGLRGSQSRPRSRDPAADRRLGVGGHPLVDTLRYAYVIRYLRELDGSPYLVPRTDDGVAWRAIPVVTGWDHEFTRVAAALAALAGRSVRADVDLDVAVTARAAVLDLSAAVLAEVAPRTRHVVSTYGGRPVPLHLVERDPIAAFGLVLVGRARPHLDRSPSELLDPPRPCAPATAAWAAAGRHALLGSRALWTGTPWDLTGDQAWQTVAAELPRSPRRSPSSIPTLRLPTSLGAPRSVRSWRPHLACASPPGSVSISPAPGRIPIRTAAPRHAHSGPRRESPARRARPLGLGNPAEVRPTGRPSDRDPCRRRIPGTEARPDLRAGRTGPVRRRRRRYGGPAAARRTR